MFLNILVAVDGSPSSRRALEQAVDLARLGNSLLTLLTVEPPVAPDVARAGVSMEAMRGQLEAWSARVLQEAKEAVPNELSVRTVQRLGHAGEEIVAELDRGGYDLVVLGSRRRGRVVEGLFGSVNGYVHFHSRAAVLSVPA